MTTASNRSHGADPETLQDSLSGMADVVRKEVQRELGAAREAAGDMLERGREKAEELREGVSDRIRERPLTSVLVATGVGVLIGVLLARRSD